MSKFGEFLKQTSEISNKDRLTIVGSTLVLMGIGFAYNMAHAKKSIDCINKDIEIDILTKENQAYKKELDRLTYLENEYYNK